ncbi:nascent polypeptide-associated complex subunit alpha, muscle-specific form-like [Panicum miliaceum]|uniref:Nascent polypeptide-associated complex subunit alpha, muscle-specific form-like n=1 Tax=Panicum miliaceum TaxID=4540 RepID=A0A3L6QXF1_PANMI|nr:nascent polypeptide-associated complex subunit alpha, muscle-specific form-like [Panicum miliaceum]
MRPKPKPIAAVLTTRMAKKSPTRNANASSQHRPIWVAPSIIRRSNVLAEKPSPKVSPPPPLKPAKVSPPLLQKHSKMSPLAMQKPLKLSPLKTEAKAKKKGQRVSFQVAAVESAVAGSREKVKAVPDDAAGHASMKCTLDQLKSAAYWLAQIRLAESDGKHWVAAEFFRLAFECQNTSELRTR